MLTELCLVAMKRWYRFRGLPLLVVAEIERTDTHTHTHTHEPSTVTLAAHARRGLIKSQASSSSSQNVDAPQGHLDMSSSHLSSSPSKSPDVSKSLPDSSPSVAPSRPGLPSSDEFSSRILAKEINVLKSEISDIKSSIRLIEKHTNSSRIVQEINQMKEYISSLPFKSTTANPSVPHSLQTPTLSVEAALPQSVSSKSPPTTAIKITS